MPATDMQRFTLAHRLVAEGVGTAMLLAAVVGSGIMGERLAGGNVAVDAGFAGDGVFIQIPSGFTAAQCRFTASPATIDGSAISTQAGINDETGEVICEKVVQERPEVPPQFQSCTASYTVICVK